MATDQNKEIVKLQFEYLNTGNVDAAVARQGFASYLDLTKPLWFTGRH